jgi:hypothetical protein
VLPLERALVHEQYTAAMCRAAWTEARIAATPWWAIRRRRALRRAVRIDLGQADFDAQLLLEDAKRGEGLPA